MRNILFRGQTPDGEWVYGSLVKYGGENYIFENTPPEQLLQGIHLVTSGSVGQMTNQRDESGALICEGDILEHSKFVLTNRRFVVCYDCISDAFVAKRTTDNYTLLLSCFDSNRIKVVGNIHNKR